MSDRDPDDVEREQDVLEEEAPSATPGGYAPSVAERLAVYQRAGGIITPVLTAIFAFFMGGLIVLGTGHNPWSAYKAIFEGSGLIWFFEVGSHDIGIPFTDTKVWFPWNTSDIESIAAANLQQTLLLTATLILTGLAVAFAFRCGLFNIGGQGQYIVGALMATWIGSIWADLGKPYHVLLAVLFASLAGAVWAGIAGFLKATVGAHEVITTIMLNWIAYWIGSYLVGRDGPLQNNVDKSVPVSPDVWGSSSRPAPSGDGSTLPVWWGDPILQGLSIGFFIAIGMLFVFWITLNRTTLGYEVRAVGFNPEAARYGGISVARSYILAMAISGFFAGLGGAIDILGYLFRIGVLDIQVSTIGFVGIAVALLGRNTAVGVFLAALLFGALFNGTSTRTLDPEIFPPELAGNLTLMIQALILLFVGADVLILYLWQARRKVFRLRRLPTAAEEST